MILSFVIAGAGIAYGQFINISVFNNQTISSVVVSPSSGSYKIIADSDSICELTTANILHISMDGQKLRIKSLDHDFGSFSSVQILGTAPTNNTLKVKPVQPSLNARVYNDNLSARLLNGRILILNSVDLEYYIAGVVEAEGGSRAESEYYKTQAILCRTYALENWKRHELEGFNLCDGVHCQAYNGRCFHNFDILESTLDTKGLVVVDTTLQLITATFHSNSGGQTENSENVWVLPKKYLTSINDEFWKDNHNSYWTKEIPLETWKNYIKGYGISVDNATAESFSFLQNYRMTHYTYGGQRIALKDIRSDFKLKSTFFSVLPAGDKLILKGRGYGHGVGLSQESAMKMALYGKKYEEIIKYFYRDVYVVSLEALEFFKN